MRTRATIATHAQLQSTVPRRVLDQYNVAVLRRAHAHAHTQPLQPHRPNGVWSQPVVVLNGSGIDSNLSPVILHGIVHTCNGI